MYGGPSSPPVMVMTLTNVVNLRHGFDRITIDEFAQVLKESIHAQRDYADRKFAEFQKDPIAYCGSRHPKVQGEALFELALTKAGP